MHNSDYDDQDPIPNPTVINNLPYKNIVSEGKTVVFTAFLREKFHSKDEHHHSNSFENTVSESWYPTIFFYDLEQNCTIWEIFGAEQFIRVSASKKGGKVKYLTNDLWTQSSKTVYEEQVQLCQQQRKQYSRHQDFFDRILEVSYMVSPSHIGMASREESAPEIVTLKDYRLKCGLNKDLEITEGVKVVEAHAH